MVNFDGVVFNLVKKRYPEYDILKFVCAFMVVCIHFPFPGVIGQITTTIGRSAVPIFFMITGFFYDDTVKNHRQGKQIKKIVILLLSANLIYIVYDFLTAVVSRSFSEFFDLFTLKNFITFLIFNESPFGTHLWYLASLLYVLVISAIFYRLKLMNILYYATPILLIGDLVFGKYSMLLFNTNMQVYFVRNFLFLGLPYFCIGIFLRKHKINLSTPALCILSMTFLLTSLAEKYLLIYLNLNADREHYLSTTFMAISVFLLFKSLFNKTTFSVAEQLAAKVGRRYSTTVYIVHPIVGKVIAGVVGKIGFIKIYSWFACFIVFGISIFLAIIFEKIKQVVISKGERQK